MMKQLLYTSFAAALWLSPGIANSQDPSPQGQATRPSTGADSPRTITGCVAPGTETGTYTLSSMGASSSEPTDRTSTAKSAASGRWTLRADSSVDLSEYVGKRVQVTGSADNRGGASADDSPSATRSTAASTGPQFHVKSVKVLAESCS